MKQKRNIKKVLLIMVVIIIIAFIIVMIKKSKISTNNNVIYQNYVETAEDGTEVNTNPLINKEFLIEELTISNIKFIYKDGITTIDADVANNTENDVDEKMINLILLDKDGNELVKIPAVISKIPAGSTTKINASITLKYIDAYSLKIENR